MTKAKTGPSAAELAALKESGFIPQKQKGFFSLRVKMTGGIIDIDSLEAVCRIAREHGKDYVHLTARQSLEIPFIKYKNVESVREKMHNARLEPGRLGSTLRTVSACQGGAVCGSGLLDTTRLAKIIERKFRSFDFPHKFKVGVTGCANNCLKAEENDIGLKGTFEPEWNKTDCTYCGLCARRCPTKAIAVEGKTLSFSPQTCIDCGRCRRVCPNQCWQGKNGVQVYYGGLFGRRIHLGVPLLHIQHDDKEILAAIRAGMDFFAEHGKKGERFASTLDRMGWERFADFLRRRDLPVR